jgi:hypothetical protein
VNWKYLNPFWHQDQVAASPLDPDECRHRLKLAPAIGSSIGRSWPARGDATFYMDAGSRLGSILEMHVRVKVLPAAEASTVHMRFSGGAGSALLLVAVDLGCAGAFVWAFVQLTAHGWQPLVGAGLLAILIPPLLIFAMRATADDDVDTLTEFVMTTIQGPSSP